MSLTSTHHSTAQHDSDPPPQAAITIDLKDYFPGLSCIIFAFGYYSRPNLFVIYIGNSRYEYYGYDTIDYIRPSKK